MYKTDWIFITTDPTPKYSWPLTWGQGCTKYKFEYSANYITLHESIHGWMSHATHFAPLNPIFHAGETGALCQPLYEVQLTHQPKPHHHHTLCLSLALFPLTLFHLQDFMSHSAHHCSHIFARLWWCLWVLFISLHWTHEQNEVVCIPITLLKH